ncbi:hypothetical protein [Oceanirhabdus sp. W0125-5]|uniref:hypothetical protein n=1 Tax=Oceanirhabdus sp. W0125-5 TaxID=2999116 RepID=UPI0022F2E2AF|nr:hypothetical protein [Oceanirhabdus sp. W0125-5]WBW95243.1 hypothetical protein OW730_16290 [Oceanirhabdus sp. W0125-5]
MDKIQLMPLRIPKGFAVCYNKFYDIEPIKSEKCDNLIENWDYFTQDILQIIKMDLRKGVWYIPKEHLIIDLGWYPDSCPDGMYGLELSVVREDHSWDIIEQKESRDRFEIRDTIERWLNENSGVKKT